MQSQTITNDRAALFVRRTPWRGWLLRVDRSGLWPVVTLWCWAMDIVPGELAREYARTLAYHRAGRRG